MGDTAEEPSASRPTTALLFTELGKLRDEFGQRLDAASASMTRGVEKFEERITARLEAIAQAQSSLALKNAHDIGVLETRVDAHEAAIQKLGDVAPVAHAANMRVDAIERARAEEAENARDDARTGKLNRWQIAGAIAAALLLGGLELLGTAVVVAKSTGHV